MRFLIAFAAVLGYASAGLIAPTVYTGNAGDAQAAVINANVAAKDYARNVIEKQSLFEENVIQNNNEAIRRTIDTNRDLQDSAYWGSLVASQNFVAAAQSKAAALDGTAAGARAAFLSAPIAAPIAPIAPLAYAGFGAHGLAPYGIGVRAW